MTAGTKWDLLRLALIEMAREWRASAEEKDDAADRYGDGRASAALYGASEALAACAEDVLRAIDTARRGARAPAPGPGAAELAQEVTRLRRVLAAIAEGDCSYGDNCPPGARHGKCVFCQARKGLAGDSGNA